MKFTESRWLQIGSSARLLVRALSVGLESYVRFVKDLPGALDSYIGLDRFEARKKIIAELINSF